jgi:hypothetical protein
MEVEPKVKMKEWHFLGYGFFIMEGEPDTEPKEVSITRLDGWLDWRIDLLGKKCLTVWLEKL